MIFPQTIQSQKGELVIAPASRNDLLPVLKLFDEVVIWLNAHGHSKQWGSSLFSPSPEWQRHFLRWINAEVLFVARLDENIVGSVVLSPTPPGYIARRWANFPPSALYLEAFTSARTHSGLGLGRAILQWSEYYTLEINRTTIWLDCWADNPALVRYYQQAGFGLHESFWVQDWRGQLFAKQLTRLAG